MGNPGFWCMTYGDFVIFPKTDSETRAREMYKHVNFKFKYDHYLNWLGWNVWKGRNVPETSGNMKLRGGCFTKLHTHTHRETCKWHGFMSASGGWIDTCGMNEPAAKSMVFCWMVTHKWLNGSQNNTKFSVFYREAIQFGEWTHVEQHHQEIACVVTQFARWDSENARFWTMKHSWASKYLLGSVASAWLVTTVRYASTTTIIF